MSIVLRGVEMPKDEEILCVNIYPDGKVCINLDLECKRIATAFPLTPHGRLIDAKMLMLNIREYIEEYDELDENGYHNLKWCAMKEAEAAIEDAPTIIPTEEGE